MSKENEDIGILGIVVQTFFNIVADYAEGGIKLFVKVLEGPGFYEYCCCD